MKFIRYSHWRLEWNYSEYLTKLQALQLAIELTWIGELVNRSYRVPFPRRCVWRNEIWSRPAVQP